MNIHKHIPGIAILALVAALFAGCSTTSSRISKNQSLFDTFPAEVQAGIRAGKVDIGYTPEMVMMALGEPSRRYTRTTQNGSSEVWAYQSKAPSVSLGLGIGSGGRTSIGTGVGVSTGDRRDDKVRVIFEGGKVSAVEQAG